MLRFIIQTINRKPHYINFIFDLTINALHYDKCVIVNMFGTVFVLICKICDWITANKELTMQNKLIFTIVIIIAVIIIILIDKSLQCSSARLANLAQILVCVKTDRVHIDISLIYYRLCSHSPHVAS